MLRIDLELNSFTNNDTAMMYQTYTGSLIIILIVLDRHVDGTTAWLCFPPLLTFLLLKNDIQMQLLKICKGYIG